MQSNKEKLVSFIRENDWYHQRFDGTPFFLSLIAEAELKAENRKKDSLNGTSRICFFENGKADWYILQSDLDTIASIILQKSDKDYIKNLRSLWTEDEERFYAFCAKIDAQNLSELSDAELLALYEQFHSTYINAMSSSSIIDAFALGTDEKFSDLLKNTLSLKGMDESFSDYFSILATPLSSSFALEAEISLLDLASKLREEKALESTFLDEGVDDVLLILRERHPYFYKSLMEHRDKYFWIQNNYNQAKNLSLEFFIKELKNLLEKNNISKKIAKYLQRSKNLLIQKTKLLEQIDAPDELRLLSFLSSDVASWQDDRKKMTFFATHYFSLILEQIAYRLSKTLEELKYMSPYEVKDLFSSGDGLDLTCHGGQGSRKQGIVFIWQGSDLQFFTNQKDLQELRDAIYSGKQKNIIDELSGLTACPGKIVGQVRVLDTAEKVENFKQGEVLVAVMTRPDYLLAMKKAAAIVTDEGGVTSHAAVISRELNIPCVVGTKMATLNFEDGDWVEVDASSGLIKKLPN